MHMGRKETAVFERKQCEIKMISCQTKLKAGVGWCLLRQAKIRLDGNAAMSLSRCVLLSGYAAFRA